MTPYARWMYDKGFDPENRREINGQYVEANNSSVQLETMSVIVVGDAMESYKLAIEFYNETLQPHEVARKAVAASWADKEEAP